MAQRHMPFGYKIIDGAVAIEPEKADLIRKMFNDFISGISLNQMAKALTEMKVLNANGKPSWNHGSIGKILSNCKYTGSDFYPAIIPEEVFNAANRLREEKNARLGRNVNYFANGISSAYPFSGRLICGECGSIFKRYTEHHDRNKKCNWKCKRYIVDNRVCCKSGVVDDKQLKAGFIQIINRVMESPEMIEKRPAVNAVAESAELRKIKMKISSGLGQNGLKPSEMAQLLFKRAVEQYRISQVDDFEYKTRKLKAVLESFKPIKAFDEALFKATIKSITVEITGQLRFELINGVMLSTSYTLRGKEEKPMAMGQRTVSVIPANPIYDFKEKAKIKKLRVAAYCRVSTELEEQQSSYQAQVDYYTMEIMKNPGWKFAGIYADEGISGTSTKNRIGFNKLIEDCMAGKIDLVLTKSISRFARNTLDCIQYIRKLKEKNIGVFFEKENVNTLDSTGEFLITILGSLAQEESRSLSTNTRWGVVRRFEKGQVMVNHNKFLSYTKNEAGELVIVPEEAEIVRLIFRLYLEGLSIAQIKKYLEENGIKTVTGRNQWSTTTINNMLSNEKYMGDALLQKSYTVDYLTKKRVKNNGIVPQYYVEDSHPAIISKDLFHRIQEEKARRANIKKSAEKRTKTDSGKYSSIYALTELLICGECGKPYRRASWTAYSEKRIVWRCLNRLEYGKKHCQKSPTIDEDVLHRAIMDAFNSLIQDKGDFMNTLQSNIQLVMGNRAKQMDIAKIEERITELKNEMIGFVEENARCGADNTDFDEHYAKISAEMKELQKIKTHYTEQQARQDSFQRRIEDMKKFLNTADCKLSNFDNQLVRQLIQSIKVMSKDKILIKFKSGLEMEQELAKK